MLSFSVADDLRKAIEARSARQSLNSQLSCVYSGTPLTAVVSVFEHWSVTRQIFDSSNAVGSSHGATEPRSSAKGVANAMESAKLTKLVETEVEDRSKTVRNTLLCIRTAIPTRSTTLRRSWVR